jgi:hypothetical protein
MLKTPVDHARIRERLLAGRIQPVAADLRLVDAADFVAFLRTEQYGNVSSLVKSSIELCFKPGTLTFGHAGDVALGWSAPPKFTFDMEFHHCRVHVYFRLVLEANEAGVEIDYIQFDAASDDARENTKLLAGALDDACFVMA